MWKACPTCLLLNPNSPQGCTNGEAVGVMDGVLEYVAVRDGVAVAVADVVAVTVSVGVTEDVGVTVTVTVGVGVTLIVGVGLALGDATAYSLKSSEPIRTAPSEVMAGLLWIVFPAEKVHNGVPVRALNPNKRPSRVEIAPTLLASTAAAANI